MTCRDDISLQARELRRQAEAIALEKPSLSLEDLQAMSAEQIQAVFHELQVHQIELAMQNEKLLAALAQIEAEGRRYSTLSDNGLFLEANLAVATQLGLSRIELVNQPISRFIFKEDQDIYYLHRQKLFETGEPQECELRMSKPDGTFFWASLCATTALGEEGAPVCRLVISDITERKQTESIIKKHEDNFRNIAEVMQETLSVIELNGTFLYANPTAARNMSGGKSENIIGQNLRELIPKVQAESLIERYQSVYQSGEPFHQEIKVDLQTGDAWFFNTLKHRFSRHI